MTEVSQHDSDSIPAVQVALRKLKAFRASADATELETRYGITVHDLDVLIRHIESNIGKFTMPDVPM